MRGVRVIGALCASALALAGCGGSDQSPSGSVSGLAASESQPLVRAWAQRFTHGSGVQVSVHSGLYSAFDPAAADFALDDGSSPSAEVQERLLTVPVATMEVAVAYNLVKFSGRRIPSGLQLDDHTIASIYKGPVFNWHQKVVLATNPGVEVPDEIIQLCREAGTRAVTTTFTSFLARSGPNWAHDVGIGPHVEWPHPNPSADTTDVPGCVRRTGGGIGYMLPADARRLGLTVAAVQEADGAFRLPGERGYPIAAPLDVFVARDACRAGHGEQTALDVKTWLTFVLGAGQRMVRRAGYAPLPALERARARAALAELTCHGRPVVVPR